MNSSPRKSLKLTAEKQKLLQVLLEQEGFSSPSHKPILKRTGTRPAPLSYAQKRLWFIDQLIPDSPVYNIPIVIRISYLHQEALQRAIQEITRRHEVLRTTFVEHEGAPVQRICPPVEVVLPVTDLAQLSQTERDQEAQRLALEEVSRPFDLLRGPLFRAALLRLHEEEHILLITVHHVIFDGWSMPLFYRELSTLYGAFTMNQPSPLPELPMQYADYAAWQQEYLQGEALAKLLDYWKQQLRGVPTVLELPTDRPRPAMQSFRGNSYKFQAPQSLVADLKVLAQRQGATLFMTLLAAFQSLLHAYTGQEDFVVGSPIANRTRAEMEDLIGFFVNTVALRTQLTPEMSFCDLLNRTRDITLGAYAHQDLPFERLVEELQPERAAQVNPLFQVMFILQNNPVVDSKWLHADDAQEALIPSNLGTAKFDLMLIMEEGGDGLSAWFEYSTDLFDEATIARMAGHLLVHMEAIALNPSRKISELPLLTQAEIEELERWNDTKADHSVEDCLHHRVEEQVERTPGAIAVRFEDKSLTYAELNARANRLAHYLRKMGIGPEVRVGVCLERSFDLPIAVLAVLKAGGVYVPLDPLYPADRLSALAADAQLALLLVGAHRPNLQSFEGRIVYMKNIAEELAGQPDANPDHVVDPQNLAYVMFTSGSTGQPKGVSVEHREQMNVFQWQKKRFEGRTAAITLQFTSLNFDVSFFEIMFTLENGGPLVLLSEEDRLNLFQVVEAIDHLKVERLFLPYSALQDMARIFSENSNLSCSALKDVVVTGEPLVITETIRRFFQSIPGCRLHNEYGPTETHWATALQLPDDPASWPIFASVGGPISNTQVRILDPYGRVVPVGVLGELYVGGMAPARGYLDRPAATAERFVPDAIGGTAGARFYKTGDHARYKRTGEIEVVGRLDNQVKVRGFRIELGEIEVVLSQHPQVKQAVVLAPKDAAGNRRIAAYVIPRHGSAPDIGDLRMHMKQKLPEYMVPAIFIFLEQFPETPSGKIDRLRFPQPSEEQMDRSAGSTPPRNDMERALEQIWIEVLGIDRVGITDNFFARGGHSLLATRVLARIRDTFQVNVPLRALFESPTIAELGEVVMQAQRGQENDEQLSALLAEIEQLSVTETESLLAAEQREGNERN